MADATNKPPPFRGFERPRQNYFKMPNNWTDITAEMSSLAEIKVVEYVLKNTWGYQEFGIAKRISLKEFMHGRRRKDGTHIDKGTGLSKPSVIAGIRAAIDHGLLLEEVDDSDLGRMKKYYRLRMIDDGSDSAADGSFDYDSATEEEDDGPPLGYDDEDDEETGGVKNRNSGVKNFDPPVKNSDWPVKESDRASQSSLHRSKKETKETNKQERNLQDNNNSEGDHTTLDPVVVALLTDQGIARKAAETLTRNCDEDSIREKVAYLEFLQSTRPNEVQKPAAWLRRAIEDDYGAPDGFVSETQRRQLEEEEKRRQKTAAEDAKKKEAQRQKAEKQRQKKLDALRRQYGTTAADSVLWNAVVQEIKASGETELDTLLADALDLANRRLDAGRWY